MGIVSVNENLSVVYGETLAVGYEIAQLPDTTVTVDYQVLPVVKLDGVYYAIKFGNVSGQFYAPNVSSGAEEIQHLLARNERHASHDQMGWDGITEYPSRYYGIPQGMFRVTEEKGIMHISSPCHDVTTTKGVNILGIDSTINEIECLVKVSCPSDENSLVPAIKLYETKVEF